MRRETVAGGHLISIIQHDVEAEQLKAGEAAVVGVEAGRVDGRQHRLAHEHSLRYDVLYVAPHLVDVQSKG